MDTLNVHQFFTTMHTQTIACTHIYTYVTIIRPYTLYFWSNIHIHKQMLFLFVCIFVKIRLNFHVYSPKYVYQVTEGLIVSHRCLAPVNPRCMFA